MDELLALAQKLRDVRAELVEIAVVVLNENATLIEDMVIEQLQRGERGDGEVLPDYSPLSVSKYGKPPGPIKLYDTGDYYRAILARATSQYLEIDNTDPKRGKIANRFGDEVMQLQDQNIERVQEFILIPGMIEKITLRLSQ